MITLANKSDEELVADIATVAGELSEIRKELTRRGVESDMFTYQDGRIEIRNFERVTREKL